MPLGMCGRPHRAAYFVDGQHTHRTGAHETQVLARRQQAAGGERDPAAITHRSVESGERAEIGVGRRDRVDLTQLESPHRLIIPAALPGHLRTHRLKQSLCVFGDDVVAALPTTDERAHAPPRVRW